MHITAIIITHNSAAVIASVLRSVYHHPQVAGCIVVDNASTDATVDIITEQFPEVRIMRNVLNMELGAAYNQALMQVRTEFALLLDAGVDIDADAIDALFSTFADAPRLALIRPNAAGDITLWRLPFIKKIGFFDPAFFFHHEDDDIVMRARAEGYDVVVAGEHLPAIIKPRVSALKCRVKKSPVPPIPPVLEYWHYLFEELKAGYVATLNEAGAVLEAELLHCKEQELFALDAYKARVEDAMVEFRKIPETNPAEQARIEVILKEYRDDWLAHIAQHEQDVALLLRQHEAKCAMITGRHEENWGLLAQQQDAYLKKLANAGSITHVEHAIIFASATAVKRDVVDVVTIAIITYRRPESLPRALHALHNIAIPPDTVVKLLIIDNDVAKSAWQVVHEAAQTMPFPVEYVVEEKRGIPHARNKVLEVASDSDYIAFVDDDDTVNPQWLCALFDAARIYYADVVKGQVIYIFYKEDRYLVNLALFAPVPVETGRILQSAWTNNVLFSTRIYKYSGLRFDAGFTKTGGSDNHFFSCAKDDGASIIFSAEGIVYSPMMPPRTQWWWIARRYLRNGATGTISNIKRKGYFYAVQQVARAFIDSGRHWLWVMRQLFVGKQPVIHPVMIVCFILGRIMGLFHISPREYK